MDEVKLEAELEALIRARMEPVFEKHRKESELEFALSDEEWLRNMFKNCPDLCDRWGKSEMLSMRHADRESLSPESLNRAIRKCIANVWAVLVEFRRQSSESGPLTLEEYQRASIEASERTIVANLEFAHKVYDEETGAKNRRVIDGVGGMIEAWIEGMEEEGYESIEEQERLLYKAARSTEKLRRLIDFHCFGVKPLN